MRSVRIIWSELKNAMKGNRITFFVTTLAIQAQPEGESKWRDALFSSAAGTLG
jgi:hypothetical protein